VHCFVKVPHSSGKIKGLCRMNRDLILAHLQTTLVPTPFTKTRTKQIKHAAMKHEAPRWSTPWLLLLILLSSIPLSARSLPGTQPRAVLLWSDTASGSDSVDQHAFDAVLSTLGLNPIRSSPTHLSGISLGPNTLLTVPHASAGSLSPGDIGRIVGGLKKGLGLITDGESQLARALGIRLGNPVIVSDIIDHYRPEEQVYWSDTPAVPWIKEYPKNSSTVVYSDRKEGHPLAIIRRAGRGRALYLAPHFDPRTDKGYGRFASLPSVIVRGLGRAPSLVRRGADAYFDAGYRTGVSPDSLATLWFGWGIRAVHAAAWYSYAIPAYDYKALIDALHRKGILIYAWLEWPYVGRTFWDQHPEWRQKNALLEDAHLDFLYLMDLQNPDCMKQALLDLEALLSLDWDGIDVAEFTLTGAGSQALAGPARPDYFVGFTDHSRREFAKREGFDPLELVDPASRHFWRKDSVGLKSFYRYRTEVNRETQQKLFWELRRIERKQRKSWELILTIVDNSLHPEFDDLLGFSMEQTVSMTKELAVTLHIEDPYTEWTKPPDRYTALGQYYRQLLGERSFMIDINVVPMKPDRLKGFSTWQALGAEFLQLWRYAAAQTDRVCFYCESSVNANDWELLPFTMAAGGHAEREGQAWTIDAPYTVSLRVEKPPSGVLLDGRPWPAFGDAEILIPAGKHRVEPLMQKGESNAQRIRLRSMTGQLLHASWEGKQLSLEYQSPSRCALELSATPARISVDGVPSELPVHSTAGGCVVLGPPGNHRLVVSLN